MTQSRAGELPRISSIGYTYMQDLADIPLDAADMPFLQPMGRTLDAIFDATISSVARLVGPAVAVSVACDAGMAAGDPILERAKGRGFLARCSNQHEQGHVGRLGFPGSRIVLAGPAKSWPGGFRASGARVLFCDSLEELAAIAGHVRRGEGVADYVGATLRPAMLESRLGIPASSPDAFDRLCSLLADLPALQGLGLELRAEAGRLGIDRWVRLVRSFLDIAPLIGSRVGRPISCLGLDGNWFSEDWVFALEGPIAELAGTIAETLPAVSLVILDAGQAFSQPAHSLVTHVLEVRRSPVAEVVVDASIRELPDADHFPHRVAWRSASDRTWRSVWPGRSSILGRLNIEADVLARRIEIPDDLSAGDLLAFCDAGGQVTGTSPRRGG